MQSFNIIFLIKNIMSILKLKNNHLGNFCYQEFDSWKGHYAHAPHTFGFSLDSDKESVLLRLNLSYPRGGAALGRQQQLGIEASEQGELLRIVPVMDAETEELAAGIILANQTLPDKTSALL